MSFDLAWEKHIYKKNLQINRYPFDWVVSSVVKYIDRKKIKKFKAVDLGCGTGNNLEFLAEIGFKEIIGIDGSQSAINFAKQKFSKKKKIKLIQGDFSKVIFDKKDFFLDRGSITHNKKKIITKLLKNIYKSLNKEGYFFSSLFSKRHHAYKNKKNEKYFMNEMNIVSGVDASFFSEKEIKKLFSQFQIISLVEETFDNKFLKKKKSMWNVICKKK